MSLNEEDNARTSKELWKQNFKGKKKAKIGNYANNNAETR